MYYLLRETTPAKLFLGLYFVSTIYFASIMVRLILVVAPALCMLSGIGISEFLHDVMGGFFEKVEIKIESTEIEIKEKSKKREIL